MLGSVSIFNSDKHTLIGGDIGDFIGRLAERSRRELRVIRYNELGVFCIIEFLSPKHDVFLDTMNLGESLANFDHSRREELERRLFRPITCDETSRLVAQGESDFHHMKQDENEEEHERMARIALGE
jgi:hypothetical protein